MNFLARNFSLSALILDLPYVNIFFRLILLAMSTPVFIFVFQVNSPSSVADQFDFVCLIGMILSDLEVKLTSFILTNC